MQAPYIRLSYILLPRFPVRMSQMCRFADEEYTQVRVSQDGDSLHLDLPWHAQPQATQLHSDMLRIAGAALLANTCSLISPLNLHL